MYDYFLRWLFMAPMSRTIPPIFFTCLLLCAIQPALAQQLKALHIDGPEQVSENSTDYYRVVATFDNGLEFDVTLFSNLSLLPGNAASIGGFGDFHAQEVGDEDAVERISAWFAYDGVTASTFLDVTVEYSVSESGSALDFDGVDDIVYVPASSSLGYPGSGGWTVEAWVMARETHPSLITPIVGQISLGLAGHDPYLLEIGGGEVHFRIENNFGSLQRVSAPIQTEWTHVAGIYDPLQGIASVYINGREAAWQPISSLMASSSAFPLLLGGQGDGPRQFDGRIDEVRIWQSARSYCEIRGYFNRRLSGTEPDLVGYWRADQKAGQIVADASSYSNHGWRGVNDSTEPTDPVSVASGADLLLGVFPPIAWTSPQFLPEISSGADYEASISSNGKELYISSERGGFAETDVYRSTRTNVLDPFAAPTRIDEVSVPGYEQHDGAASLSANMLRLYFARANGHGPGDLWVATRPSPAASWNAPAPISSLNAASREEKITVSGNELHAVFTSDRSGEKKFWSASRTTVNDPWQDLAPIAALSGYVPRSCSLTPDALTLYFTAIGPIGLGSYDVWMSRRSSVSGSFATPVHMPSLSTPYPDLGVGISPDGSEIYLVPENGFHGNIYVARFEVTGGPLDSELDCDGDLDLNDYLEFASCLVGPDLSFEIDCRPADYDGNNLVDLADFAHFQNLRRP